MGLLYTNKKYDVISLFQTTKRFSRPFNFLFLCVCVVGYRHVQLRTQHNESLEVSSLFIYSHRTEEGPAGGATASSLVRFIQVCCF